MMRKRIGLILLSLLLWTGAAVNTYAVEDGEEQETLSEGRTDNGDSEDDEDDNGSDTEDTRTIAEVRQDAKDELDDYKLYLEPNEEQAAQLDAILKRARSYINGMTTADGIEEYVEKIKDEMYKVVNPSSDDDEDDEDDDEDDTPTTYSTNSKLVVCDNWATPTAVAGQSVNVVIPITNMDVYDVRDIYVEPVLAEESESFPFEIEKSSYMVKLDVLPGSGSIADPLERRQEITYTFKTRKDAVTGYKKLTFEASFTNANGDIESATLELYVYVEGKSSSGSNQSVPRVIVTGYTTEPETVHAGEAFTLKVMLQNTSKDTEVGNMKIEFEATEEGSDDKVTSASFVPESGSNTLFLDSIPAGQSKEISIGMTAKSDLAQNSYQLGMSIEYEDESANAYNTSSSLSIPVKQDAKFDVSSIEVMPATLSVGSESNVMFSIYNTGKTSLYNVTVSFEADSVSGGDTFVGNIETGGTGNVDAMVTGAAVTEDDGTVKVKISYEDANGEVSTKEQTMTLMVTEEVFDDVMDDMMLDEEEEESGPGILPALLIVVILIAAVIVLTAVVKKMRAKKKEKALKLLEQDKSYFEEMEQISLDDSEEKK